MSTAVVAAIETSPEKREYTELEYVLYNRGFVKDMTTWWGSEEASAAFIAEIFNQARKAPDLYTCSRMSIRLNLGRIAALRLNPALPNMVAFIPRNGELTVQYGYAGLRELVMRHPDVKDCFTRAVCANDHYEPPATLTGPPEHRLPGGFRPRGPVIGYFAVIELRNGHWRFWPMSVAEIDAHVKTYIPKPGPAWSTAAKPDTEGLTARDKMSMKTCLRMLCNGRDVPLTAAVAQALEVEAVEEREPIAAESQGYDRQGHRPALTASTGMPLEELLQDVSGTRDHQEVEAQYRAATGQSARRTPRAAPTPVEEAPQPQPTAPAPAAEPVDEQIPFPKAEEYGDDA